MQDIALFSALSSKMDYLNQRQRVISQNIANSDTPNYRPNDLVPVDFRDMLKSITSKRESIQPVLIEQTSAKHLNKFGSNDMQARERQARQTYEVTPAGNAVVVEEQLLKSGKNVMDHTLMTNLYQKHMSMLRVALGQNR